MSNKVKDKDIKNRTYHFINDIINIKNFDPNNIKIEKKSCKNILIYCTGYVTIKDSKYVKVDSVNHLYLISRNINGSFEEINESKYLRLIPTYESKGEI